MVKRATLELRKRDVRLKDVPLFYKGLIENKMSVGVHKEQGEENLKHALWNEFGTNHITGHKYKFRKLLADGHFKNIIIPAGKDISVPMRPFVRIYFHPTFLNRVRKYFQDELNNCFKAGLKAPKSTAVNLLLKSAKFTEEQMKKIASGDGVTFRPNASLTVAIKGFDQPLYQTGKMINAIKGKVKHR